MTPVRRRANLIQFEEIEWAGLWGCQKPKSHASTKLGKNGGKKNTTMHSGPVDPLKINANEICFTSPIENL